MRPKADTKRRSARSHEATIDATLKLLGSSGYVDFSIEKVASVAGVGKQTIYRWWPSRAELVLEVWRDRLLPPLTPYDGQVPLRNYLETSLTAFGKPSVAPTVGKLRFVCWQKPTATPSYTSVWKKRYTRRV